MYYEIKQYTKKTFPSFFIWARDIKDQLKTELKTLRQVGFLRILQQFVPSKKRWVSELPVQSISKFYVKLRSIEFLCQKYSFKEGGHTIYLPLSSIEELSDLKDIFPDRAGIKIVKRKGNVDAPFSARDKTCKIHKLCSPSHKDLLLVHNLFYSFGMGPRLYDLMELEFTNGDIHMAYIMEHIEGKEPAKQSCEDFIDKIKALENKKLIKLVNWNGYGDMDFICPGCNGNLLQEKSSKNLKYVDLQNFALGDYYTYLKKTALQASSSSHFGDQSYLMGGKYLYQAVPGLNMPAKRSPADRYKVWKELLVKNHLTIKDKIIIDIGCNLGLMSAQYLKDGAAWIHGFDMPEVIEHTEAVLLTLGCTKFSLTGTRLSQDTNISDCLPENLRIPTRPIVISYLAIRGHIGWIKSLADVPWDFMLYEGHQEEDEIQSRAYIDELNQLKPCHVIEENWISDANSSPRYIAIIKSGLKSC